MGIVKPEMLKYSATGFRIFYDIMHQDVGFTMAEHMFPVARALCDDRIKKLLVIIGPGSGKSLLISVAYIAYVLGCRPEYTCVGISAGEALMQGFQGAIMSWIEHSPRWRVLFPNVRPDKNLGWSTEAGMFVHGHRSGDPDASYIGMGITSKRLTGVHGRIILCDDLHDAENSMSEESCLKVRDVFYRQIMGRADPQGAKYICVGRRWHQADIYGHLKDSGEYVVMELPAMRNPSRKKDFTDNMPKNYLGEPSCYWDIRIPEGLTCCFNEEMQAGQDTVHAE